MKRLNIILLLLISTTLFCSQYQGEQPVDQKTQQDPTNENDLIISDDKLDFSTHKVTFIELGADRCIPCKAMQPIMHELALEYENIIQVVFYDVWKKPEYGQNYGIRIIPTQVFIDKKGEEIFRHVGFFAKEEIIATLKDKNIL